MLRSVAVFALLWLGVALELIAVLGVCVLRDALDRLHCVSLGGYGVLLVGSSILVRSSFSLLGDKALLTGVVVVAFGTVLVHTSARSMRIRLLGDWRAQQAELREPSR